MTDPETEAVPMGSDKGKPAYVPFCGAVGATFPSLKVAASTAYYFQCDRMPFEQCFPTFNGRLLLKTDLWDEAKNTEIHRDPLRGALMCRSVDDIVSGQLGQQEGASEEDSSVLPSTPGRE